MTSDRRAGLRRPVLLMIGSSALLPLIGLISAPILARGLGADGRGLVSAAGAPGTLLTGLAALGLPEALTYFLAKDPGAARRTVWRALWLSLAAAVVAICATVLALPFLASGDAGLRDLIVLATLLAVPQLLLGVLRGAATGLQLWRAVALERVIGSGARLPVLVVLYLTGGLTPSSAVLTICLSSIAGGITYLPLIAHLKRPDIAPQTGFRVVVGFGGRIWLGAIAGIVLSRIGQVLFAPLSDVTQLGLFVVGITIADVPLVIAFAVRDALYGVSSKSTDAAQVAVTTRFTLVLTTAICLVLGGSLPLWIAPLFGPEFQAAVVPTWLLMATALVSVPGYLAAAGLGAWGRPGLRSFGLIGTLLIYVLGFVLLVPLLGALGAGLAGIASGIFSTSYMVIAATRTLRMSAAEFLIPRRADLVRFVIEGRRAVHAARGVIGRRADPID